MRSNPGGSRYKKTQVDGRTENVHRLVWEAAHGPIPEGYVIHHINENKYDNRLSNLRMMTNEEHTSLHRSKHPKVKTCVICSTEFTPVPTARAKQQTCSHECKRALLSIRAKARKKVA